MQVTFTTLETRTKCEMRKGSCSFVQKHCRRRICITSTTRDVCKTLTLPPFLDETLTRRAQTSMTEAELLAPYCP